MKRVNIYKCVLVKDGSFMYEPQNINTAKDVAQICAQLGYHEFTEEVMGLFCVSAKGRIVGYHEFARGIVDGCPAHPREIFKRALENNATCILLVHNHPSGNSTPSADDINATKKLKEAGELMGIPLMDHIIIGDEAYSMKANQFL